MKQLEKIFTAFAIENKIDSVLNASINFTKLVSNDPYREITGFSHINRDISCETFNLMFGCRISVFKMVLFIVNTFFSQYLQKVKLVFIYIYVHFFSSMTYHFLYKIHLAYECGLALLSACINSA